MEDTLEKIHQRADSYKFLSDCFYPPNDELMHKVVDVAKDSPFFYGLECCVPPAIELELLKVDFAELFVGPYKLLAPPYGSVYLEDGGIMGESSIDAKNRYESEGLDIVIKDAPDHITVELEFMYYLISKQIEASKEADLQLLQSSLHKQASFLQSHLGRWIAEFAENVKKNASTEFYRNLAHQTEQFVQNDMTALFDCDLVET